jgi:hypothetical protein
MRYLIILCIVVALLGLAFYGTSLFQEDAQVGQARTQSISRSESPRDHPRQAIFALRHDDRTATATSNNEASVQFPRSTNEGISVVQRVQLQSQQALWAFRKVRNRDTFRG